MVLPPSYAKAVTIKNTAPHAVVVTAWFGSDEQEADGHAKIKQEAELAPDAEVVWGDHTYDMGSWQAVAALAAIETKPAASAGADALAAAPGASASFTPQVRGIVPMLTVEVGAHASTQALQITAV